MPMACRAPSYDGTTLTAGPTELQMLLHPPMRDSCSNCYLNIHAAGGVVLNKKLLEHWWRCAHSPHSNTTERSLLIAQGVLGHQPHPVQYLVGQVLVHRAVIACEGLQHETGVKLSWYGKYM